MSHNNRTPAAGTARVLGNVVVGTVDTSQIALSRLQIHTVARRFGLLPATAAAVAELAYGHPDHWRGAQQ